MIYCVYILQSLKVEARYYIGQTSDIERRLENHNQGYVIFTKRFRPWKVLRKEIFKTQLEAIKRERYLKTHAGRRWLKNLYMPG